MRPEACSRTSAASVPAGSSLQLTGGVVISEEKGLKLEQATLEMLGTCDKVTVSKDNTTIVNGAGDKQAIQDRIAQIKKEIEIGRAHV